MKEQNFRNHVRMHPLFHYVLMPLVFVTVIGSILHLFPGLRGGDPLWFAVIEVLGAIGFMIVAGLTRGYANRVQDRIVRLEENVRYHRLTGQAMDPRLTFPQIIALRFASDDEFVELAQSAVAQNLGAKAIKQAITRWRADHHRV